MVKNTVKLLPSQISVGPTQTLHDCVLKYVQQYLKNVNGYPLTNLYQIILEAVERPMLEETMRHMRQNQMRTAHALGLSRGTLHKKLVIYDLLKKTCSAQ